MITPVAWPPPHRWNWTRHRVRDDVVEENWRGRFLPSVRNL